MSYLRQVRAIVWKDLIVELRTRERTITMAAFTVLVGILFNFAIDSTTVLMQDIAAGLVWMTIVFSGTLGLGRTFQLEAHDGAFQGVLLSPTPKDAVYLGKAIANFILVFAIALLVMAVFALFFNLSWGSQPFVLIAVLALGTIGFSALGTLFSAMASGTTMGETLLPVLLFPLFTPVVIYGVSATSNLLTGQPVSAIAGHLRMLGAFALVSVFLGAWLFRFVVEE